MQTSPPRGHFTDLDGMRGVLAVIVMLHHIGLNSLIAKITYGLIPIGRWGLCVDFFFILSGFVLYFSLERVRPSYRSYFVKRVRRLAPAFLISTVAVLLATWDTPRTWVVLLANFAMVQSLLAVQSINFPAWSIPFELFLPALILPVIGALAAAETRTVFAIAVSLAVAAAVTAVIFASGIDPVAVRAFFGLSLGMVLGRIRQLLPLGSDRPVLVLSLFLVAILVMAMAAKFPLLAALFPPVSAVCIFFGTQTRTFLSSAPFQAIGRWSYSIYLLHIPMLLIVVKTIGTVDGNATLKAFVAVATIAAAAAMFRFVERPLMQGSASRAQTAS